MAKDPKEQSVKDGGPSSTEIDKLRFEFEDGGAEPPEDAAPVKPIFSIDPAMLGTFWKILFSVIARSQGEHWNLTEGEAAQLGNLSAPIVEKWMPAAMNKYGAEMILASSLIFIAIPRLQIKKKVVKVDEKDGGDNSNPR